MLFISVKLFTAAGGAGVEGWDSTVKSEVMRGMFCVRVGRGSSFFECEI
jgi:hypothetical protein